ncbi:FUSC family protein [Actinoplanes teichomyceticus]|uniref:Fusaric acid resistance family protein n=1 Tax=Actinoplanes teichomyceticus TaxID=1867 RepID=A0A561VM68_ACTTI|nr:FUSC family protein [Actinoplanes teichomyceticus]TWG12682.1 fusaric acid resistance family protein [Actinoplanes teichomyceticus]GIF13415.1 hypothetical protein Ate01nite_34470 [Actinoplanes teichomyceticus]
MTTTTLRRFWHVAPHAGAHLPALRMGISAAGPLVVLALAGRPGWGAWALFGTLTAAYGRSAPPPRRLRMQAVVGLLLVAMVVTATALAAAGTPGSVLVLCTALVAAAGTVVADRSRWSPPGSLFPVFTFSACGALPATAADVPRAAALSAAGLAWALLVTAAGDRLRPTPSYAAAPARPSARLTAVHAVVCLVAAGVAGAVALAAGWQHPGWAMVAAVVPVVGPSTGGQLLRAGHRLAGTLCGVLVAGALFWHAPGPLAGALLLGALLFGAELLIARNYALALLCVTPVTIGMARPGRPGELLALMADRAAETALGVAVVAVLVLATHRLRVSAATPAPSGR